MAERRMFSKKIIDSDAFLDMPLSTQALYFHLSMRADDEGFVGNPKRIRTMIGASEDDLKLLIVKRFILVFESGVVVIKHWKIHNYIQNDRATPTTYVEEKETLTLDDKKAYTERIHNVSKMDTQVRLGKDSIEIGKDSLKEEDKEEKEILSSSTSQKFESDKFLDFIDKYHIGIDNYDSTINEMDFNLLEKAYSESDWLKENITSFKKICELYPKIISGYYKEYKVEKTAEKTKTFYELALEEVQREKELKGKNG